jgi:hypothetical protein
MIEEYTTIADLILRVLKKVNSLCDLLAATSHRLMMCRYYVNAGFAAVTLSPSTIRSSVRSRPSIDTALGRCQRDRRPAAIRVALRAVQAEEQAVRAMIAV